MNKKITIALLCMFLFTSTASAASITHTVKSGDTMWKIAVKYEVGFG